MGWVRAETAETERVSSVLGTPCETAVGEGAKGWSGGMREARGWIRAKMAETEWVCSVLGTPCGTAVEEGGKGWWW